MITDVDLIDVKNLNKAILDTYNLNFSDFATTSYKRRVEKAGNKMHMPSMEVMIEKIRQDKNVFDDFISNIIVDATEFFRDPSFWRMLRHDIISKFKTNNTIRFWVAGVSTGEELFTLAILLKEEGLYDKSKILATEISELALSKIKSYEFDTKSLEIAESNYERFEGKKKFTDYCVEKGGSYTMKPELLENVNFQARYLDDENIPGKYDLILCRNVLLYTNPNLQDKIVKNFSNAMFPSGYLAIGVKESIVGGRSYTDFVEVSHEEKIYKKK
jgi:chemotaxis protein methyltransferase CheR